MFYYSNSDKKRKTKPVTDSVKDFLKDLIDYAVCLYIMLMLAVFPFYFTDGYIHIGSDKAEFFCRLSVNAGRVLVLPVLLYLLISLGILMRDNGKQCSLKKIMRENISLTDIFAFVYCRNMLSCLMSVLRNKIQHSSWCRDSGFDVCDADACKCRRKSRSGKIFYLLHIV